MNINGAMMPANDNSVLGNNNISAARCGTATGTLTATTNGFASSTTVYPYGYNYYYPYNEPRITALEAEVRVLREMLAAVLSGREIKAPTARRKRTK